MKRIISIMSVLVAAITMARAQEPTFYVIEQGEKLWTSIPGAQISRAGQPVELWNISLANSGFSFNPGGPPGFSVGEPPGEAGSNAVEILGPKSALWASDLGPLPSIVPNIVIVPNVLLQPTGAPALLIAEDLPTGAPDASSSAALLVLGLGGLTIIRVGARCRQRFVNS